jgi:hypothetical protein
MPELKLLFPDGGDPSRRPADRLLFRCIGQSQVIGEMAAGIVLGPSLLGGISLQ